MNMQDSDLIKLDNKIHIDKTEERIVSLSNGRPDAV